MTSTSQQPTNSPHTSKDDIAFPPDSYSVQLGDSFTSRPSKRTPSFYSFKFNSGGDDRSTADRKVSLSKVNDDSYTVEYAPLENANDNTEMTFDAIPGSVQELDCVLVFDEETKTFTLERPLMKFTLRNLRRKRAALAVPTPSTTPSKPAKRQKKSTKTSSMASGKDKKSSNNNRNTDAATTATTTAATKTTIDNTNRTGEQRRPSVDDADLISKDIDAVWDDVLGDDDDDDDDDDNNEQGQSSKNMAATSPGASDTDIFEEVIVHETTPTTNRRKIKMASQPIRRPDSPRREFAGKTYSPAAAAASLNNQSQRRTSVSSDGSDDDDDGSSSGSSSSGSDSSSGSSSGSESGSSESDSSDDEDMTDLIENVERGMDATSAPASPAHQFATTSTPGAFEASPYTSSPATAPRSTPARNGGPVSLRALFDDPTQQDDESITSSDSDASDSN
ncbi:hypothetical protein K492DRAFT_239269 [Lichtheimia hyalospora FSU 10163]|nr:hypothetical protein K492DRAFT_239269 [Lichtheimia hyalospora FSU 10163]